MTRYQRVVVLVTPKERKMWGKAAKRWQYRSLAEFVRQIINARIENAQDLPIEEADGN